MDSKMSKDFKNKSGLRCMAHGGKVSGPGGPTDDKVPAMLSAGEFVLPADTVKVLGADNLDRVVSKTHTPVSTGGAGPVARAKQSAMRKMVDGGFVDPIDELAERVKRSTGQYPARGPATGPVITGQPVAAPSADPIADLRARIAQNTPRGTGVPLGTEVTPPRAPFVQTPTPVNPTFRPTAATPTAPAAANAGKLRALGGGATKGFLPAALAFGAVETAAESTKTDPYGRLNMPRGVAPQLSNATDTLFGPGAYEKGRQANPRLTSLMETLVDAPVYGAGAVSGTLANVASSLRGFGGPDLRFADQKALDTPAAAPTAAAPGPIDPVSANAAAIEKAAAERAAIQSRQGLGQRTGSGFRGDVAPIPGVTPSARGDKNGGLYDQAGPNDVIGSFNGKPITKAQAEAMGGGLQSASMAPAAPRQDTSIRDIIANFGGGRQPSSRSRDINEQFDKLAAEIKDLHGGARFQARGTLAKKLLELGSQRASALGDDARTGASVYGADRSANATLASQLLNQEGENARAQGTNQAAMARAQADEKKSLLDLIKYQNEQARNNRSDTQAAIEVAAGGDKAIQAQLAAGAIDNQGTAAELSDGTPEGTSRTALRLADLARVKNEAQDDALFGFTGRGTQTSKIDVSSDPSKPLSYDPGIGDFFDLGRKGMSLSDRFNKILNPFGDSDVVNFLGAGGEEQVLGAENVDPDTMELLKALKKRRTQSQ